MSIIIESSMNFCSNCGSAELVKKIPEGDNLERFVCNKCGHIHYQNPNIVTGVLAYTDQHELILCKRSIEPRNGYWTLPAPESSEVELFKFNDIPWSELAFPTVIKTLKLFLEYGDSKVINETLKPRV